MPDKDSQFRNNLQKRLDYALAECVQLRAEYERLRGLLGLPSNSSRLEEKISDKSPGYASSNKTEVVSAAIKCRFSQEQKIAIFRKLFRGREDVYPVRWESKNGKSGYSPTCANVLQAPGRLSGHGI